jgi:drug/metabolite transporter (DMT)-like permease
MGIRLTSRAIGNLLLVVTAFIWGAAFVAQRAGMAHLGPFAFNGLRSLLAGVVLVPVWWVFRRFRQARGESGPDGGWRKLTAGGLLCGACLFAASSTQQIGLMTASASHGGFITALYILIVPFLSFVGGRRVRLLHFFCAALGCVGLWFLCAMDGFSTIGRGDWWLLACAVIYSFHILAVARYAPRVDPVALSVLQFLVAGVLSLPWIPFEPQLLGCPAFSLDGLRGAIVPFLYAGLGSSAIAYTLQIVAQRYTEPTVASLLMCLESVFAALVGCFFGERLTGAEILGCALMFAAILLAQVPEPRRK